MFLWGNFALILIFHSRMVHHAFVHIVIACCINVTRMWRLTEVWDHGMCCDYILYIASLIACFAVDGMVYDLPVNCRSFPRGMLNCHLTDMWGVTRWYKLLLHWANNHFSTYKSLWTSSINTRNNRSKYLYVRHCDVHINCFAELLLS